MTLCQMRTFRLDCCAGLKSNGVHKSAKAKQWKQHHGAGSIIHLLPANLTKIVIFQQVELANLMCPSQSFDTIIIADPNQSWASCEKIALFWDCVSMTLIQFTFSKQKINSWFTSCQFSGQQRHDSESNALNAWRTHSAAANDKIWWGAKLPLHAGLQPSAGHMNQWLGKRRVWKWLQRWRA